MSNEKDEPQVVIVIPARYASVRFPGKPLALLDGVPVIVHVARAALQTPGLNAPVVVATDDERIAQSVREHCDCAQVAVAMTDENCATGTDRIAQAMVAQFGAPESWARRLVVINVQGDEPFVDPEHLALLARAMLADDTLQMATLAVPIDATLVDNPNLVKVVCDQNGRALYFSRARIPFGRDGAHDHYLRHLGVYAYDARWLMKMAALPPTPLEQIEKLEQLRALENGIALQVLAVESNVDIAIDTPEDLQRAQRWLDERNVG